MLLTAAIWCPLRRNEVRHEHNVTTIGWGRGIHRSRTPRRRFRRDARRTDRHPDFVVIGPDLGIVVLEVKDWRLRTIAETRPDGVVIKTEDGERLVRHPLEQAREYTLRIVDLLQQRPELRTAAARLCCGWGYGAVLPALTTADIQTPSLFGPTLEEVLGVGLVLTGEDLTTERLLPRLRALVPSWAQRLPPLEPGQVDQIRAVLYPEIRVGWARTDAEIFAVMDREQERLARSLGAGHRLLRGVAGSGKTITLICRARHLRETQPSWRILVLCFNRVLADFLAHAVDADDQVEALTFHSWCSHQLRHAGIGMPPLPPRGPQWDEYWVNQVPQLLLQAYAEGRVIPGTYQAILIDEGQDFADDWYRVALQALDPQSGSLFIATDSSQNIYRRKVSWRDLGVHASGRTRVLRLNYRNTRPVLGAAYRLISELDSSAAVTNEPDEYVIPDRAVRNGPPPEVHRAASHDASRRYALEWIRARLARGIAPEHLLVLALSRLERDDLTAWLNDQGVPACPVAADAARDHVRLSTIHSAKGLDAGHVLLVSGHELEQRDEDEGRRLLYIAMTRAREELCVCYQGESRLMAELEAAVAE